MIFSLLTKACIPPFTIFAAFHWLHHKAKIIELVQRLGIVASLEKFTLYPLHVRTAN